MGKGADDGPKDVELIERVGREKELAKGDELLLLLLLLLLALALLFDLGLGGTSGLQVTRLQPRQITVL